MRILSNLLSIFQKGTKNGLTEKENVKAYLGSITIRGATRLAKGQRVLTVAGVGTILGPINNNTELIVSINSNYRRHEKKENLLQYYVYNQAKMRYLPLSFADYIYVLEEGQSVVYRITNRGFAKLLKHSKENYGYIKKIIKARNGLKIYQQLKREGYEIRKKV